MHEAVKRFLFLALGTISLILGLVGMFLPILPTTPFFLLTAFLFMHSSEKWHNRLMSNKITGPVIADYKIHKSIPMRKKVVILSLLWSTMLINIIWLVENLWIDLLLLIISAGVTIHILRIKTRK